jgi:uncharacterized membrane protein
MRLASIGFDIIVAALWAAIGPTATVWVVRASQSAEIEPFSDAVQNFGLLTLVLVPISGVVAGRRSFMATFARVGLATFFVWLWCIAAYSAAMFSEPSGEDNSNAAAVGGIVLGIPLLVILLIAMSVPALCRLYLTRAFSPDRDRLG